MPIVDRNRLRFFFATGWIVKPSASFTTLAPTPPDLNQTEEEHERGLCRGTEALARKIGGTTPRLGEAGLLSRSQRRLRVENRCYSSRDRGHRARHQRRRESLSQRSATRSEHSAAKAGAQSRA